ncbi:hypothetical protein [Armatimonas sp.]|uniref:hypothetical protein n=1 Tax=Armatimonas sp. TaxID=1872638 RepID=UPI00286A32CF|nr:hypothetical protein [Armatimonas sp.]
MTTAQSLPLLSSLLAFCALPALAHPRDELGQASYVGITPSSVTIELSLTPGEQLVAPFAALAAKPDYPQRVLTDLCLSLDGKPLMLNLLPKPLTTGEQSTKLYFSAPLVSLSGGKHTLRFENHHTPLKSAYLAATLAGTDGIQIGQQTHDATQQTLTVAFQAPNHEWNLTLWLVGAGLAGCLIYARKRRR